jgi:photosystem II stability/assembly factor-like uncharacterized protein
MSMSFHSMRLALAAVLISGLLGACGGGGPAPAPVGGLTAVAGDGQVTLSWAPDAGVDYWLFFAPTSSISTTSLSNAPGHQGRTNITSPYVLAGLTNGVTYSFTIDGRYGNGAGGPGTPSVSAVPRPAGTTWTPGTGMGTASMRGIAFGAAATTTASYIAVGDGGALYQSTDGISNWTAITTSTITTNLNAAVGTLSKFIAVGDSGNIFYSSDTVTWPPATSNTTQKLNALTSNGTIVVAVGDGGTIRYSFDGGTWYVAAIVPPISNNLYGVTYAGSGLWLAVGAAGTLIGSLDGINWTAVTSNTFADLKGIAYRPATTITDPATTPTVTSYPATYTAVGLGGTVVTSTDGGITWIPRIVSPASDLLALYPTVSQFLAVGAGGAAFTSVDGINWTSRTTGTTASLFGLINAQAQYIAVGQGGTNIYSR